MDYVDWCDASADGMAEYRDWGFVSVTLRQGVG